MFKRITFSETTSTNDIAKKLLEHENAVMVSADWQTKGRGRNGKIWVGEKGANIYVSFGFKTEKGESGEEITKYQMIGSLAVLKTLKEAAREIRFSLKYPNDIIAENGFLKGKISGVLCEHEFMGMLCFKTVIGIGINIEQEYFENVENNQPVSLKLLKVAANREALLKKLEENITELLNVPRENIFEIWKAELNIIDRKIGIRDVDGEWKVREIANDGRLKVFKSDEMRVIDNGDSIRYF